MWGRWHVDATDSRPNGLNGEGEDVDDMGVPVCMVDRADSTSRSCKIGVRWLNCIDALMP
jgi:hypothetical protein